VATLGVVVCSRARDAPISVLGGSLDSAAFPEDVRMTMIRRAAACLAVLLLAAAAVTPVLAQKDTPTQFYTKFREAFDKAKSIDDLLPYMSKQNVDQVKATPEKDRAPMFEMMHEMGVVKNLKVTKETKTATGATLQAEGLGPDGAATHGTIEIISEGGAWKVGNESWSSGK